MSADTMYGTEAEDTELEILENGGAVTLAATDRAAIDVQVATAKRYPRSVDKSLKEALTLATLDEDTAASCFYSLPRSGKTIEGPSARLAEIMAYSWGNLRADADIVDEDRTHITAMGTCFDLERNVAVRVRVKRRITDKHGNRYGDDLIGVTGNAAISIALRNAVFKVIPAALTNRIYRAARRASIGEAGTIAQKRQNAVTWFAKTGIPEETLYDLLDVEGLDDIGEDELITLRGLKTALTEGETSVEQILRRADPSSEETANLNEELRQRARGRPRSEAEPSEADHEGPTPEPDTSPEQQRAQAQVRWIAAWDESGLGSEADRRTFEKTTLELDEEPEPADLTKENYEDLLAALEEVVAEAREGEEGDQEGLGV